MNKTPPIDADALLKAIKASHSVSDSSVEMGNPFADLIARLDETKSVSDIEVGQSFKPPLSTSDSKEDDVEIAMPSRPGERQSTLEASDELTIPNRSNNRTATASAAISATEIEPAIDVPPAKRRNMRGLATAAVALIAVFGTGYLYLQGAHTASSETVVYEVPIFDDEVAINALPNPETTSTFETSAPSEPITAQPAAIQTAAAVSPTPAALPTKTPEKPRPFGFDDKFSEEFPELEGQSLLDLATGVATFAPAETVPNSEWGEVSCGGCHSFNQTNLCEQGAYYFNHDKQRIGRIQHPYGGGFKTKLMEWAEGGCL